MGIPQRLPYPGDSITCQCLLPRQFIAHSPSPRGVLPTGTIKWVRHLTHRTSKIDRAPIQATGLTAGEVGAASHPAVGWCVFVCNAGPRELTSFIDP